MDNLIFTLPAPAKINRFMRIVKQRADKMHELQTLFQFIDLCDYISFYRLQDQTNSITTNLKTIDGSENIVIKAANLLKNYKNRLGVLPGIHIELQKNIPIGAGLGGGSSNAATCLWALNYIWQLNLTEDELATLGLKLGADVPIFIRGLAAYAEGVGEIITPVKQVNQPNLLLIYPGKPSNTAEVFRHQNLSRNNPKIDFADFNDENIPSFNDSAALVKSLNASVNSAWQWLEHFGSVCMSGTGASIYIELNSELNAKAILEKMPSNFAGYVPKAFIVQAVNISPLKTALNKYL